jgi:hypothetical protein
MARLFGTRVERRNQLRAAVAGHPHEGGLDPGIQVPAAPVFLQEGIERRAGRASGYSIT